MTAEVHDTRGIDAVLEDSRTELDRVTVREAYNQLTDGALLIDIRPVAQRQEEGEVDVPVLYIERNVLEWRLDPWSEARIPEASQDARILVLCQEGYASSLAAESLQRVGLPGATDVIGGFRAWREAGLPVAEGR
ncbi:rhodanese-like domain-containing protein [Luteipulveratus mongoliensis]|uniref:Sulfurtransferase n=1 Tax=Luteipulveratus mongoliensis TaxID=571913 RepID=A0A0K1JQM3_9MICO|nr:rhodanese-like domain-containing protein [Luteipulveratus mongoliensis]AKU18888.1 sulfurtransferase [Luteipulveratus mongoliensis]